MEKKLTEEQIDYSYKVLETVCQAIDYVVTVEPERLKQLINEIITNMPEIFDAFMIVSKPEHRPIIYQLFKSTLNLIKLISMKAEITVRFKHASSIKTT